MKVVPCVQQRGDGKTTPHTLAKVSGDEADAPFRPAMAPPPPPLTARSPGAPPLAARRRASLTRASENNPGLVVGHGFQPWPRLDKLRPKPPNLGRARANFGRLSDCIRSAPPESCQSWAG